VPTTLKRNVVPPATISAQPAPIVYDDWMKIPRSLRSSGMWHGEGRGVRKTEKPRAYFDPEDVGPSKRCVGLYDRAQTYELTEPTRSKRMLARMFVRRNELFGLRPVGKDRPIHRHTNFLHGSVSELVYKSFDYSHRGKGTPTGFRWERERIHADAFYVLAPEQTDWFVIDIDNHRPTKGSTESHLRLVRHLVEKMPEIARSVGASSVFFDYAQDSPRGIHIWVTLHRKRGVKPLHHKVRTLLRSLADPRIDADLQTHGLKRMGMLEILPTEGQLIRMFGGWDRRVFTTEELRPKKEAFDAEGLLRHIKSGRVDGNPFERYASLARAGLGSDASEAPVASPVQPGVLLLSSATPSRGAGYIGRIVEAFLNGVTECDVLYEAYLSPLAQALYWREFHDRPDRARLTEEALLRWIDTKHNGMVTRITEGKRKLVVEQIRHVVKKLPFTQSAIRNYWAKVVANDRAFLHQKISFVACIDAVLKRPVQVSKNVLQQIPSLLAGGGDIDANGNTYNRSCRSGASSSFAPSSLPPLIEARLRDHLRCAKVRKGKVEERILLFSLRLLNEIGVGGTRTIHGGRMNQLAGVGQGRNHIRRYKKLLLGAGILEPGWKNTASQVKKLAARYDLTSWALDEVRKHWNIPATDTSRAFPGHEEQAPDSLPRGFPIPPVPSAGNEPVDLPWQEDEYLKTCGRLKNGKIPSVKTCGSGSMGHPLPAPEGVFFRHGARFVCQRVDQPMAPAARIPATLSGNPGWNR